MSKTHNTTTTAPKPEIAILGCLREAAKSFELSLLPDGTPLKWLGLRVFLPIPKGKKGPNFKDWQNRRSKAGPSITLRWAESDLNIGVLLGEASDGLIAIDVDSANALAAFLDLNPILETAPRVVGSRGAKIFVEIAGDYPDSCKVRNGDQDVVDWLADGRQAIVWGIHPEGMPYRWQIQAQPPTIRFSELKWPDGWTAPFIKAESDLLDERYGLFAQTITNEQGQPISCCLNQLRVAAWFILGHELLFEPTEVQFYSYNSDNGLWERKTRALLTSTLAEDLRKWSVENNVESAVIKKLQQSTMGGILGFCQGQAEHCDAFAAPKRFIHVQNGMIDLSQTTPILRPFGREYLSRNQCPITWKQDATCPRFINELLAYALNAEDISLLQRWFGSVLLGGNSAQRFSIIQGEPGSGKSTVVEILQGIIGCHNVCELRTEHLSERFELGRFVGKQLLVGDDVPADFLQQRGVYKLKSLVGNDLLTGELKQSNSSTNFKGQFGVVVVANSRLRIRFEGDIGAWRRRILIFDFKNNPTAKRINRLGEKLLVEEGEGILAWAVKGAIDHIGELARTGDFELTPKQKSKIESLLSESDSVAHFIESEVKPQKGSDLTTYELENAYAEYCDEMGWAAVSRREVEKQLPNLLWDRFRVSRRNDILRNGTAQRGFSGIGRANALEDD